MHGGKQRRILLRRYRVGCGSRWRINRIAHSASTACWMTAADAITAALSFRNWAYAAESAGKFSPSAPTALALNAIRDSRSPTRVTIELATAGASAFSAAKSFVNPEARDVMNL